MLIVLYSVSQVESYKWIWKLNVFNVNFTLWSPNVESMKVESLKSKRWKLKIWNVKVWMLKVVLDTIKGEFCLLRVERLVPCGGNMTARHNGTIKRDNKNLLLPFISKWKNLDFLQRLSFSATEVSMEVFTKPGRALKCCNKLLEMESNHVICGL